MNIYLINPNLVTQKNDPFTTGIVYMPIMLAYTASALEHSLFEVKVIDAYAENPKQVRRNGQFLIFGRSPDEVAQRIDQKDSLVIIYAINVTAHCACIDIIRALRRRSERLTIAVLENSQAVTAYALDRAAGEFYEAGADYILTGEMEASVVAFARAVEEQAGKDVLKTIDGVGFSGHEAGRARVEDLDRLLPPAWKKFPLQNYWDLGFAHGPLCSDRYLPILTSRGCPYSCRFCVTPAVSGQKWRARSAKNIADEMKSFYHEFGVREFHIEDLNPTVSDERMHELCFEIEKRKLDVIWKFASGAKAETIRNPETIRKMAGAGCRYISISPESGSTDVLTGMNKSFDFSHAAGLIDAMKRYGIYSQACFVLGFPGETEADRRMTWDLVRDWTRRGIDEIALFIMTPVPGSAVYQSMEGYSGLSELNFTPAWRKDYPQLKRFRLRLYFCFLVWKLRYHPLRFLMNIVRFVSGRFMVKMEMVPFRAMKLMWWSLGAKPA